MWLPTYPVAPVSKTFMVSQAELRRNGPLSGFEAGPCAARACRAISKLAQLLHCEVEVDDGG